MDSSPEPRPEPKPAPAPQAAPKAAARKAGDADGTRRADAYTDLPQPPAKDNRAALWAALAAAAAMALLAAQMIR